MEKQFSLDANYPVVKNHKVYGQELLPGLAYIDMLYQVFYENGYDYAELELRNLSIVNPLTVEQGNFVMVSIQCSESKKGRWQIHVEGQKQHNGILAPDKILYVTAEMHRRDRIVFEDTLDLNHIKILADRMTDLDEVYEQCRRLELLHSGFMKAEGSIYREDATLIIVTSLGREALPSASRFMFHPTLIDSSAIGASKWLSSHVKHDKEEKQLFLPLFYESFYCVSLFQKLCVTRIQAASVQRKNELIRVTMEFFGENGKKIGELRNLTCKLVRYAGLVNSKREEIRNLTIGSQTAEACVESTNHCAGVENTMLSSEVETLLRQLFAEHFQIAADKIDTKAGYYDMGLDSPGLLKIVQSISAIIDDPLPPTLLFEFTTIADLSTYLAENYSAKLFQNRFAADNDAEQPVVRATRADASPAQIKKLCAAAGDRPSLESEYEDSSDAAAPAGEDIAIIGMAGRFPKAGSLQDFWANLKAGIDCIDEVPETRWDRRRFADLKSPSGKNISKWGGFIDDPDCFDNYFFSISPREAETMDPQERIFLEVCWEAMEDAGYTPKNLVAPQGLSKRRYAGVFAGVMHKDYTLIGAEAVSQGQVLPLSLNHAPIANRVSYVCNFHGPSMAVDTVCSSSLTALHLAMESIRSGTSAIALAGGVNLSLHPDKYLTYGILDMHSRDGRCRTFGQGGDGYVSGEGVGVVLLKPLGKAIQDHDHIYAVIKGSAINHGGAASGITVPNPVAQADVITACLRKTGIDPRTISYVEAHGTGTALGDPIEIQGLINAYRQYTTDLQFCPIGSIKSNIGHAESAAGISGLIKVALQLYYRTLVPSLHAEELNPYIDFQQSPFYVQRHTEEWKQPKISENGRCVTFSRRAGLSSFGATGSNAHVILEEYIPCGTEQCRPMNLNNQARPLIIPLSAQNKERLQAYAGKLLDFLKRFPAAERPVDNGEDHKAMWDQEMDITDLAYTLQVGREALDNRVIFIVNDIPELIEKLGAYCEGKEKIDNCWQGKVEHSIGNGIIDFLNNDRDALEIMRKWISKGYGQKIAEFWVKGFALDWELFYGETKPRRMSLPTYPFARERHWISESETKPVGAAELHRSEKIHPLLHKNNSDLTVQRFSSTFSGREFFLHDHVVNKKRVLPGVAYLEMARAAVEQAAGPLADGLPGIRLKNVVWARPVVVEEQPVRVNISLFPEDDSEIIFEIHCENAAKGSERIVHSQGRAELSPSGKAPVLDLRDLQVQCNRNIITAAQYYETFRTMNIDYGMGHRGIEIGYVGQGQVLAKLTLPSSVSATRNQYFLHPSLLDSALQATVGMYIGADDSQHVDSMSHLKPFLPFELQELEIFGRCTDPVMWALIRYSKGSKAGDNVQKMDIDLCDDQGIIRVRMKGFSARALEREIGAGSGMTVVPAEPSIDTPFGDLMLIPRWDPATFEKGRAFPSAADKIVMAGGKDDCKAVQAIYPLAHLLEIQPGDTVDEIAAMLKACSTIDHMLFIAPRQSIASLTDEALIEDQKKGVLQILRLIKALLYLDYGNRNLGWSIITIQAQPINKHDGVNPTHASLHGLVGCMAKEYPNWNIRLIDLDADNDWPVNDIFSLPADRQGRAWVYRSRQWYRQQLVLLNHSSKDQALYKPGGVYVVIGGAGSIGEVWSEYMIRTYQAQVIWIGRREKNAAIQGKLDRLAALGPVPCYIAADATNRQDLQRAYGEIKKRYTGINGLVHSAMVLAERNLADMTEKEFQAVLSAKVVVSVRMAQVFQAEPLDFVLFFSSLMAITKAAGQSNYAAGCSFKDAFACQLGRSWPCAVKVINWGYLGIGEIEDFSELHQLTIETYERLAQIGIGLIEQAEAMKTLETLLAGPLNQIALIKTTKPLVIEGMSTEEWIDIYPETIHSHCQNLLSRLTKRDTKFGHIQSRIHPQVKEMDELLCRLLWGQLHDAGMFSEQNPVMVDQKSKTGLHAVFDRWHEESLSILARHHYLQYDGESYTAASQITVDINAVWEEWNKKKDLWIEDVDMKSRVALAEATVSALPEILTGKVSANDVMFPNSSMELVERIFKNNPVADYLNGVLADTLIAYIEERLQKDPLARIRVLEIGAGTGGTGGVVLQKLSPYQEHIQEYCYADVSKESLLHAKKEYDMQKPYLIYKIFNVETPVAGQGIDRDAYDVVIAANALHATGNIRQTLRNVKAILHKNGLMILNEMCCNSLFLHLTLGLLEKWWLYEDQELRIPGCPGIYPETWQKVLESEGFRSVFFPSREANDFGQVVVAESDGIVLQKRVDRQGITPMSTTASPEQLSKQKLSEIQAGGIKKEFLREKSTAYIKKIVGEILKMPVDKIDSSDPLVKYGIDSIMVVQLGNALSSIFENINNTLFFEYPSIDALIDHFLKTRENELRALVGMAEKELDMETDDHMLFPQAVLARGKRFLRFRGGEVSPAVSLQDIAIIGLAGRYPGAENVDEFWCNLKEGRNCITQVPPERRDLQKSLYVKKGENGSARTQWGGFLKDIDKFDSSFFQIEPEEVDKMSPQERLFLETAYAGIEDAGYTPATLSDNGKVGVFVGVRNGNSPTVHGYWSIANRVSNLFNFKGPSMAVDTAGSSSLTAIHLALESLHSGTSECAIAGGVNLNVFPARYPDLPGIGALCDGDACKSFADQADGFFDGEGVGAVVLKPLNRAIADGDHIFGIVKGSLLNSGGKTNGNQGGNQEARFQLISQALRRAGVDARAVSYVEVYGSGTVCMDPAEITGMTKAFREYTNDKHFCAIGSVKSNIGHAESVAGIAGVTKVLMQLKHHQLVPSLNSNMFNSGIDFSATPFKVQTKLAEWKRPTVELNGETRQHPRIAGISAYGAGGANAHLVVAEFIPQDLKRNAMTITAQKPAVILLSARSEDQLQAQAQRLLAAIGQEKYTDRSLADIAYTLQVGREVFEERLGLIAASLKDLEFKLRGFVEGKHDIDGLYRGRVEGNREHVADFMADEDLQQAMDIWLTKGKYSKLLGLWAKGLNFDWKKIYGDYKPKRISLPTYPFAKESCRVSGTENISGNSQGAATIGKMMLQTCWKEQTVASTAPDLDYAEHLVVLCEPDEKLQKTIQTRINMGRCIILETRRKDLEERFNAYAVKLLEEIQRVIKDKKNGKALIQVVVASHGEQHLFSGFAGLLKSARLEDLLFIGQLIEVDKWEDSKAINEKLTECSKNSGDNHIRYQAGRRLVAGWSEVQNSLDTPEIPWKDRGVYLITGGGGGLGLIFAREIVKQVKNPTVLLTGRSILSEAKQLELDELAASGARVEYKRIDVSRKKAVADLIGGIEKEYGRLNGIIHSAGVINDGFILNKAKDDFLEVLAPKVKGTVNLDLASKDLSLDFFILFSSLAGSMGNYGQSDYATANAFMNAYARYRNSLVVSKQRYGRSLSIDWPLWEDGGMHVHETTVNMMRQKMGMIPMRTAAGITAFYQALASDLDQVIVIEGELERLQAVFDVSVSDIAVIENREMQKAIQKIFQNETLQSQDAADLLVDLDKLSNDEVNLLLEYMKAKEE